MMNSEARKRIQENSGESVSLTVTEALDLAVEMLVASQTILSRINKEILGKSDEGSQS